MDGHTVCKRRLPGRVSGGSCPAKRRASFAGPLLGVVCGREVAEPVLFSSDSRGQTRRVEEVFPSSGRYCGYRRCHYCRRRCGAAPTAATHPLALVTLDAPRSQSVAESADPHVTEARPTDDFSPHDMGPVAVKSKRARRVHAFRGVHWGGLAEDGLSSLLHAASVAIEA